MPSFASCHHAGSRCLRSAARSGLRSAIPVVVIAVGTRVLRQHYEGVGAYVAPELGDTVEPWMRHRRRFLASLSALDEEAWRAPTRCSEWTVSDVVAHILTADQFWIMSLTSARSGA